MHRNDVKRDELLAELSVSEGHVNDLTLRWLQQQAGVTSNNLNDAWKQYNDAQGATGHINDAWYQWLNPFTTLRHIADKWKAFWSN